MAFPRVSIPGGISVALIMLLASALFSDMHLKGFINHDVKLTVADKSCVTYDFRYLFGINAQFSQLISLIFYPALRHKPYEFII